MLKRWREKQPKTAWKMCREFSVTNIDARFFFPAQKFFMSFASKKFPAFINQPPVNRCVLMMMMSWTTTNNESPLFFCKGIRTASLRCFFVLFQQIIARVSRANNFCYAMLCKQCVILQAYLKTWANRKLKIGFTTKMHTLHTSIFLLRNAVSLFESTIMDMYCNEPRKIFW